MKIRLARLVQHHHFYQRSAALTVLCAAILFTAPCSGQSAGHWSYTVGNTFITPKVSSGDMSGPGPAGIKIDVGHAYAPTLSASTMLNDHLATEFRFGLPTRHDISGKGTYDNVGKIASIRQTLASLFLQYRFQNATAAFRPYIGVGLAYAHFPDVTSTTTLDALLGPTTIKADDHFGGAAQIGAIYRLTDRWFVDASVTKTFLKTKLTLTSGCIVRTIDARLDPVSVNVSVGYQF